MNMEIFSCKTDIEKGREEGIQHKRITRWNIDCFHTTTRFDAYVKFAHLPFSLTFDVALANRRFF